MSKEKNSIFRSSALDRLSSPEQLDQLMQVVSPKDWLPLAGLAIFGSLGLFWSIFGSIPITVTAKGILINPRGVLQFQSPISGQLQSLNIRTGQCVQKDEILAIIDPSAKKQELQQQRDKLAQVKGQIQNTTSLREQATNLETKAIIAERNSLKQKLQDTQQLTPRIKEEQLKSVFQQRLSLQQQLKDAEELTPVLQNDLLNNKNCKNKEQFLKKGFYK